jgi:GNAT superfamily N-acetyltransferase
MVVVLKDGHRLTIREITPEDKVALSDSLHHLSEDTIYKRFLSPKPDLSSAELRYLTEPDGHDHYALVATPDTHPDQIRAVGRFVRLREEPETAEVAIVVADHLQGQGLGRQLGLALADAAKERGIRQFTATMLGDNVPAQRLMTTISARVREGVHGGVRNLTAELAEPALLDVPEPEQPGLELAA